MITKGERYRQQRINRLSQMRDLLLVAVRAELKYAVSLIGKKVCEKLCIRKNVGYYGHSIIALA